jgi:hypothetical protein
LQQKFWRGTQEEFDAIETKDEDTMYIIIGEDGENVIESSAQSDWNINDPGDPAYIHNRPFYDNRNTTNFIEGTYKGITKLGGFCKIADSIDFNITDVNRMGFKNTVNHASYDVTINNGIVNVIYEYQAYNIYYQFPGESEPTVMAVYFETAEDAESWFGETSDGAGLYINSSAIYDGSPTEFSYSLGHGEGELKTFDAKYLPDQMITVEIEQWYEDDQNSFQGIITNKTPEEIESLWDRLISGTSNDNPVLYLNSGYIVVLARLASVEAVDMKSLYFTSDDEHNTFYFHVNARTGDVYGEIVPKKPVG